MKRGLAALMMAGVACVAGAQVGAVAPILPDAVKWTPSPATPGLESAWFVGAADKPGMYVERVKLNFGTRLAPHTHPDERISVVLSGTIYVGFGEVFDESQVVAIPTGGMYVAPAGFPHYVWARDGEASYQESGVGPTGLRFVKRADAK